MTKHVDSTNLSLEFLVFSVCMIMTFANNKNIFFFLMLYTARLPLSPSSLSFPFSPSLIFSFLNA